MTTLSKIILLWSLASALISCDTNGGGTGSGSHGFGPVSSEETQSTQK